MKFTRIIVERKALHGLIVDRRLRDKWLKVIKPKAFESDVNRYVFRILSRIRIRLTGDILKNELSKKRKFKLKTKKRVLKAFKVVLSTKLGKEEETYVFEEMCRYGHIQELLVGMEEFVETVNRGDLQEAEAKFMQRVFNIRKTSESLEIDAGEVLEDLKYRMAEMKGRFKDVERNRILFGIKQYDKILGGLFSGEVCLVFGEAGIGKSIFLLKVSHRARLMGKNVMFFTLEMPKQQVELRYDSLVSGFKYRTNFRFGRIASDKIEKWKESLEDSAQAGGKLYIIGMRGTCTIEDIDSVLNGYAVNGMDPNLIIIDFLDMLSSGTRSWSEQQEHGKVALQIKRLAMKYDCPSITITHRNMRQEEDIQELHQSDVGYSQRKNHFCDLVMGMFQTEQDKEENLISFQIVKGREGRLKLPIVKLVPNYDYMRLDAPDKKRRK